MSLRLSLVLALALLGMACGKSDDATSDAAVVSAGEGGDDGAGEGGGGAGGDDSGGTSGGGSGASSGSGGAAGEVTAGEGGSNGDGDGDADGDDAGMIDAGSGCVVGGVVYPDGSGDIPAEDGCNTCSCNAGALGCTKIACPDACVVARNLDSCCDDYVAASLSEVAVEECLVPYPATAVDPLLLDRCFPGAECAAVLCAPETPDSRIAATSGSGCGYADECAGPDDCVLATDISACCACPSSMPASLVEREPCLVAVGEDPPIDNKCPVCNTLIACEPCPASTDPTCVTDGDALNACN